MPPSDSMLKPWQNTTSVTVSAASRRLGEGGAEESRDTDQTRIGSSCIKDDLREPQRRGAGVLAVGEYEVQLGVALATFAQGQGLERACLELLSDSLLRQPGETVARARGLDGGRQVAHRPALRRLHRQRRCAPRARLAHHQLAMRAQVLDRELAPELVKRVIRVRGENEAHPHQGLAHEPLRNRPEDRELGLALEQRIVSSAEHRLDQFDSSVRALRPEARKAAEQQPGRKNGFHGEADLGLPSGGEFLRRLLQPGSLLEQVAGAAVKELARGREARLAPLDLESLYPELGFELLHGVGHRRLALVQGLGGFGVAPLVHDREQRAPLVEGDPGCRHISNK